MQGWGLHDVHVCARGSKASKNAPPVAPNSGCVAWELQSLWNVHVARVTPWAWGMDELVVSLVVVSITRVNEPSDGVDLRHLRTTISTLSIIMH